MDVQQLIASSGVQMPRQRLSVSDIFRPGVNANIVGGDVLNQMFASLGMRGYGDGSGQGNGPVWAQSYEGESGPNYTTEPTAEALKALEGYTFDWNPTGTRNEGTFTAYDPSGKQVGNWFQQDTSGTQSALEAAALAAAGFTGLGAIGAGPLAGLFGGAVGASGAAVPTTSTAAGAGAGSGGLLSGIEYGAGAFGGGGGALGANAGAAGLGAEFSLAGAAGGGSLGLPAYGAGFVESLGVPTLAGSAGAIGGGPGNALSFMAPGAASAGSAGGLSGVLDKLKGALPTDVAGWAKLAAPVLQGAIGSNAAGNAVDAQQAATNQALAEIRRQYDLNRADFTPFRQAGTNAIQDVYAQSGQVPTAAEVMAQPGYQFGLDQGQLALDRKASAMGGRVSGAALQAANQWGADYATTKYNDAYSKTQDRLNRLINIANIGAGATSNNAQLGQNSTNAMAGLITSQGDANAAGQVAGGNIWSDVIGQIGGALMTPSGQKTNGQSGNALWQLYGQ